MTRLRRVMPLVPVVPIRTAHEEKGILLRASLYVVLSWANQAAGKPDSASQADSCPHIAHARPKAYHTTPVPAPTLEIFLSQGLRWVGRQWAERMGGIVGLWASQLIATSPLPPNGPGRFCGGPGNLAHHCQQSLDLHRGCRIRPITPCLANAA